jgi:hypothetical protein
MSPGHIQDTTLHNITFTMSPGHIQDTTLYNTMSPGHIQDATLHNITLTPNQTPNLQPDFGQNDQEGFLLLKVLISKAYTANALANQGPPKEAQQKPENTIQPGSE